MKIIKNILPLLLAITVTSAVAQTPVQIKKTTTVKAFDKTIDDAIVPCKLIVFETDKSKIMLNENDSNKVNQRRVITPPKVTKVVYADGDYVPDYDYYMVLRYNKDNSETLNVLPSGDGFNIFIDNEYVEHVDEAGLYPIDNDGINFLVVEEFIAI